MTNERSVSETRLTLMVAIARRQTVSAQYNGEHITLAPHLLFERHGDLFLCAFNYSKNWRDDEDRRLGQFKLAGLARTKLLDETFDPLPVYDAAPPRSDDTLVMAIEGSVSERRQGVLHIPAFCSGNHA